MTLLKEGDKAPDFTLPGNGGTKITLSSYRGQPVVLYFYPKDDTPGCTKQACSFNDNLRALQKVSAAVIGVSRDSVTAHDKFIEKFELSFPLASDTEGEVCNAYGVWVEKSMYGKTYMGIERTTFLIDADGIIAKIWPKVKVDGHTDEVMTALKNLS